jgi:hypothetical protein
VDGLPVGRVGIKRDLGAARPCEWAEVSDLFRGQLLPHWSHDDKELFYSDGAQNLMTVPVKLGSTFEYGQPRRLLEGVPFFQAQGGVSFFQPSADDKRFLALLRSEGDAQVNPIAVVTHWEATLKK